jgi:hypothetical protein
MQRTQAPESMKRLDPSGTLRALSTAIAREPIDVVTALELESVTHGVLEDAINARALKSATFQGYRVSAYATAAPDSKTLVTMAIDHAGMNVFRSSVLLPKAIEETRKRGLLDVDASQGGNGEAG